MGGHCAGPQPARSRARAVILGTGRRAFASTGRPDGALVASIRDLRVPLCRPRPSRPGARAPCREVCAMRKSILSLAIVTLVAGACGSAAQSGGYNAPPPDPGHHGPSAAPDAVGVRGEAVGGEPLGDPVRGGVDVHRERRIAILVRVGDRVDARVVKGHAAIRRGRSVRGRARSMVSGIGWRCVVAAALGRRAAGSGNQGDDGQGTDQLAHGAEPPCRERVLPADLGGAGRAEPAGPGSTPRVRRRAGR